MMQDAVSSPQNKEIDEWFDQFIASLRVDQLELQTDTAGHNKKEVYHHLIEGNGIQLISDFVVKSTQLFVFDMVNDFIKEIMSRSVKWTKLAFDLSDKKVLVWAEVEDDDESSEDGIILAQAKTNYHFQGHGFSISTTIVEEGDHASVPSHYVEATLMEG